MRGIKFRKVLSSFRTSGKLVHQFIFYKLLIRVVIQGYATRSGEIQGSVYVHPGAILARRWYT